MNAAPLIVAAMQAPTLLNIWARSPKWRLEVAELGDHEGLAEAQLIEVPRHRSGTPRAVLVCAPSHVWAAKKLWPSAHLVWVIHNGRPEIYPDWCRQECVASIALSRTVGDLHLMGLSHSYTLIVPAYAPKPRFGWAPHVLWTMVSRPSTRHSERSALIEATTACLPPDALEIYGQDQPRGFLDHERYENLVRQCSAYVTPLPLWAGFGLAEHEMLAAGVPVIGPRWGDLASELTEDYVTLGGGPAEWALSARLLGDCGDCARRIGALGPAFVAEHRTEARMNLGVEELLDLL